MKVRMLTCLSGENIHVKAKEVFDTPDNETAMRFVISDLAVVVDKKDAKLIDDMILKLSKKLAKEEVN